MTPRPVYVVRLDAPTRGRTTRYHAAQVLTTHEVEDPPVLAVALAFRIQRMARMLEEEAHSLGLPFDWADVTWSTEVLTHAVPDVQGRDV